MKKFVCTICGYVYDEAAGIPDRGIKPGTTWENLPQDWSCPLCGAPKSAFREAEQEKNVKEPEHVNQKEEIQEDGDLRELSFGELSAICSNLMKGCEKQYLSEEAGLFAELADYFKSKASLPDEFSTYLLSRAVSEDLAAKFPAAAAVAEAAEDRGAKRALVWSEKVSRMMESLLNRYQQEQDFLTEHTRIYVCDICGFIYMGDTPPDICPVCKVPNLKITEIKRG
ncbi:rubredoxin [Clostridium sp. AM58-1XD]|uniref:rubredoxin n=1 Tax=Clostridium sp. AM58-1XD TaxID=2292307 RepID=UPI000E4FFAD5|nr:rubredoxin [Clostridium sp. AM58-1XD]RGZ01789.1 rubredoxin [Clostridium sp. AM58-1XD]